MVWISFSTEVLIGIINRYGYQSMIEGNVYILIESLCILLFFYKQMLFKSQPAWAVSLAVLFCCAWVFETLIWKSINDFSAYYRVGTSFIIVLMSISALNRFILSTTKSVYKESLFLIYTGFIILFTINVLVNAFFLKGLDTSNFVINVYFIYVAVSFIVNLIYFIATLRIPNRPFLNQLKPFSIQSRA
jgi:hypothetical protein